MPPKRKPTNDETIQSKRLKEKEYQLEQPYKREIGGKRYWLIKAEPETRIVKGKDVKFSIHDLEKLGYTSLSSTAMLKP
ncbi:Thymocyte nuclear protein 1 [Neolecta irregularis DAH-3]|uniref:Thymocyte nuclear protein 1 n=1 Tax=Neolecta irregularis (strain DAH-3) TaxID=1198029 RepID=A0A1U7LQW1_NEOID|nr:Thymocyte nuclear protein 1 [Neolecta irregularis DAH-3]|eukprot:OLL25019.1 Thymocyte nuclear protein 1 [Neolecta irregularis DAH-3]